MRQRRLSCISQSEMLSFHSFPFICIIIVIIIIISSIIIIIIIIITTVIITIIIIIIIIIIFIIIIIIVIVIIIISRFGLVARCVPQGPPAPRVGRGAAEELGLRLRAQ